MERVYKIEGILFKILPCLLIAMYAVMCLFGSYVCAADVSNDEILIKPDFMDDFSIPKPPSDLYYAFFVYLYGNGSYYCSYYFSFSPLSFSTYSDENGNHIAVTSDSDITSSGFSVGDKGIFISNMQSINYTKIKNILINKEDSWASPSQRFDLKNSSSDGDITDLAFVSSTNVKLVLDGNYKWVFQEASQELAKTTMISTQITSVDFSQVLTEVLQILLIALPVVILVIALTKAIKLLFQVLRNA